MLYSSMFRKSIHRGSLPLALVFFLSLSPAGMLADDGCESSLSEIRYEFLAFRFQTVVEKTRLCLQHCTLSPHDLNQVYELLVLALVELQEYDQFREALKPLLRQNPGFEFNPMDPNLEADAIFWEVRAELAGAAAGSQESVPEKPKKNRWKLVAAGAGVVAGAAAAMLFLGGGDEAPVAGFPKPPGRPN